MFYISFLNSVLGWTTNFLKRQVIRHFSERRVSPVCEHVKSTNIYHSFNACKQIKKKKDWSISVLKKRKNACMLIQRKHAFNVVFCQVKIVLIAIVWNKGQKKKQLKKNDKGVFFRWAWYLFTEVVLKKPLDIVKN